MKEFDIKISKFFCDTIINYGIIDGNNTIVLIKTGTDETIYGYKNKYLGMAHKLNKDYGYTVICSSNPSDGTNPLDNAMELIEEYIQEKFEDYKIYYIGNSNGALIGAWWGYKYTKIKKMLLINGPLAYNFYKTKAGIKMFEGDNITFIYGKNDPSAKCTELLKPLLNEKIKLDIIPNVDHYFTNEIDTYINLPDKYLK